MVGIPDEAFKTEPMKILSIPGHTIDEIPPDAYGPNQVNTETVKAVGSWVGLSDPHRPLRRPGLPDHQGDLREHPGNPDTAPFLKASPPGNRAEPDEWLSALVRSSTTVKSVSGVDPALIPPEAK
ncbi:MAG: hypothetical protein R3E68_10980 [Burkholderiaceae bacterium]